MARAFRTSGSSSNRYGNNVQITTSRITTDKGELASGGQLTSERNTGSETIKRTVGGSTSVGTRGGYQYYEKKYERN